MRSPANRWSQSPFRDPDCRAFALAAARYLLQKDIPAAFALAFPERAAPSLSAVNRLLVGSTSSSDERSVTVPRALSPHEFAAGWLAGNLR